MRQGKGFLLWGLVLIYVCGSASAQYYYSDNRQVPLYIDSTRVTVSFYESVSQDTIYAFAQSYARIDSVIEGAENIEDFQTYAINSAVGFDDFIDTLRNSPNVRAANPYYMYEPGEKLLVGDAICCKFYESTPYEFIDSLNSANGVDIVYEKNYAPKEYLLRLNANAVRPTLETANYYYELPEVEYSHPDFLGGFILDGTPVYDYYWAEQWAMQRVFESGAGQPDIAAFSITAGSPDIIVAVLDDGVAIS